MTDQWTVNGLPLADNWTPSPPCASGEAISIVDSVTLTGVPATVTSVANGAAVWSITLNDGSSPPNFTVDHYDGAGNLIDHPMVVAGVDGSIAFNHPVYLSENPVAPNEAANKAYVDGHTGGISDAPSDGTTYARNSAAWTHLAHTDITDWTATLAPYALTASVPVASVSLPIVDGTAAAGASAAWSRGDHVHPTDASRYAASNPSGYQTAGQVTASLAPYALTANVPVASNATPLMDGSAAAGTASAWARADHVHPVDTSRYAASNPSGYQTAAQVGALITAAAYTLPTASTTVLGGVKVDGTTIHIAAGVISSSGGGIADAPSDGNTYGRNNAAWVSVGSGGGITDAPSDGTAYARKSAAWAHLTHTDITDWTATLAPYALTTSLPAASTTTPLVDGTAAVGTGTTWARADHVHPTDATRYAASNPSGYQTAAQVTAALPVPSLITPIMDGTAALGVDTGWARGDHVHPVDTSRYAASNPSGYQTAAQVTAAIPAASSTAPVMDGTAAVGVGATWARGDHAHPSDTSRYAASNPSGYQTAAQVGALITAAAYVLPTASASVLGGVKVDGTTITITSGVISAVGGGGGIADAPNDGTAYARKSLGWAHLTHTDITDWTATLAPYALATSVPAASAATPLINGTAAAGSATAWSRGDHVHPIDTSRAPVASPTFTGTVTIPTGAAIAGYATTASVPVASSTTPAMDGTAAVGTGVAFARNDHVHPSDTSRLPLAGGTLTGTLNGVAANFSGVLTDNDGAVVANAVGATAWSTAFGAGAVGMVINKAGANTASLNGANNGVLRWQVILGNSTAESGSNAGSGFAIQNFTDAGASIGLPMQISRAASTATFSVAIVNGPSDRTMKENVEPLENALDQVMALQGVAFNMIATPDKPEIGLIAQDVQAVVPEVIQHFDHFNPVTKGIEAKLAIDYPKLTALLIEAVKSLKAEVDTLRMEMQNG